MSRLAQSIMLTALLAWAAFAHAERVTFQNELSACVTVKVLNTVIESNLVLANTRIQLHKSIGDCGCFSALASYTSSVNRGGVRQVLQEALIGLKSGGEKTLVLAAEPSLVANKDIQVRLACAGPL